MLNNQLPDEKLPKETAATHSRDFFQLMFDATDMFASIWQPYLKCAGRYNLELAGLAVRQAQASMQFGRAMATCASPVDMMDATARYWECVTDHCAQSSERIATTTRKTVATVMENEVVPLPVRTSAKEDEQHDMIVLPDSDDATRKVA